MTPTPPARTPLIRHISDTALWVAAYRALESERADALFHDPLARRLAGERGFAIARRMGLGTLPRLVALRTRALDEEIMGAIARGADCVLNLAAGLDARPFRLDLPASLRWIEVDLPPLMAYKESLLAGEVPRCRLERVSLDLADRRARFELLELTCREARQALVITEGLLVYLDRCQVADLARDLHDARCVQEWVTDLVGPAALGLRAGRWRALSQARAPLRFGPAEGTAFFQPFGWDEAAFHDLVAEARRYRRDVAFGPLWRTWVRLFPPPPGQVDGRLKAVVRLERHRG